MAYPIDLTQDYSGGGRKFSHWGHFGVILRMGGEKVAPQMGEEEALFRLKVFKRAQEILGYSGHVRTHQYPLKMVGDRKYRAQGISNSLEQPRDDTECCSKSSNEPYSYFFFKSVSFSPRQHVSMVQEGVLFQNFFTFLSQRVC